MGSRRITDEETVETWVARGYAGLADEFASSDGGAVARHGHTVLVEVDGALTMDVWDSADEATKAFRAGVRRMRAAARNAGEGVIWSTRPTTTRSPRRCRSTG